MAAKRGDRTASPLTVLQSSRSPGSIDSRGLDGVAALNPGSAARAAERRVEGIGKSGPSADAGRVGDGLVAVAGNGKAGAVGKPVQLDPDVEDVLRRNRKTPTPDAPTRRAPTDPGRRRHWSDRPPAARPPRSIAARTIRTWRRRRASRCCSTTRRWYATSRRRRAARRAVAKARSLPASEKTRPVAGDDSSSSSSNRKSAFSRLVRPKQGQPCSGRNSHPAWSCTPANAGRLWSVTRPATRSYYVRRPLGSHEPTPGAAPSNTTLASVTLARN